MTRTRRVTRAARGLFRLCVVGGAFDERRGRRVVQAVAASGRRGVVPILEEFQRLVRLDRERHRAVIESAAPLPPPVRAQIEGGLARTYGPQLETLFAENAALIGGVRIRVGSDVYDGSIRGRLAALLARL